MLCRFGHFIAIFQSAIFLDEKNVNVPYCAKFVIQFFDEDVIVRPCLQTQRTLVFFLSVRTIVLLMTRF
jgi:hypothetical protein